MAKNTKNKITDTKGTNGSMNTEVADLFIAKDDIIYARNATTKTIDGDVGKRSNEQANYLCSSAPYDIIGTIYIKDDTWVIMSTDEVNSEIGLFESDKCSYTKIVNSSCLNFSKYFPITGISKENEDGTYQIYWEDRRHNYSRTMNINYVPWVQNCSVVDQCTVCVDTDVLDCEKLRLVPKLQWPEIKLSKGVNGGEILNGSYFALLCYCIKGQKVSEYSPQSNVLGLHNHNPISGSLMLSIKNPDPNFDEMKLVIVGTVNNKAFAKEIGIYNTTDTDINIDIISESQVNVPISELPLINEPYLRADKIYSSKKYAFRIKPESEFDFNYQPLANQIRALWVAVEYDDDYYKRGGTNTGYMGDENYLFFIRWIRDTGHRTTSSVIPGRPSKASEILPTTGADTIYGTSEPYWKVKNTASVTAHPNTVLQDGGIVIAEGEMGYCETTDRYPSDRADIWNSSSQSYWGSINPDNDLCGKNIRLHKFPDSSPLMSTSLNEGSHYGTNGKIRIKGVRFTNIKPPLGNDGMPIKNIVGYEILRGSREGNKTVIAKGMINNMRVYPLDSSITSRTGLYQNYPYNDLRPDTTLSSTQPNYKDGANEGTTPLTGYSSSLLSFHSPDTSFKNPYLSSKELRNYGCMYSETNGKFIFPKNVARGKLLGKAVLLPSLAIGLGIAVMEMKGDTERKYEYPRTFNLGATPNLPGANAMVTGNMIMSIPDMTSVIASAIAMGSIGGAKTGMDAIAGTDPAAVLVPDPTGINMTGQELAISGTLAGLMASSIPGTIGGAYTYNFKAGKKSGLGAASLAMSVPMYLNYMAEGTRDAIEMFYSLIQYRQYNLQYVSECKYDKFVPESKSLNNSRRYIDDSIYLKNKIQDFAKNYRINNINRPECVLLKLNNTISDPSITDNSRRTIGTVPGLTYKEPTTPFKTTASSYYGGLKQKLDNQYGKLNNVKQIPTSYSDFDGKISDSPIVFGGDIYVGLFSEKNTFFYFNDWAQSLPDGAEFNYKINNMLPYARYQADFVKYDISELLSGTIMNIFSTQNITSGLPRGRYNLDGASSGGNFDFAVKDAYQYLFQSGTRYFYVESEINVDFRDYGDKDTEDFYEQGRNVNIEELYNTSIIRSGNYYKYDTSLSIENTFRNMISWGFMKDNEYDPIKYDSVYKLRDKRVLYSMPTISKSKKDGWKSYLTNNYFDFDNVINSMTTLSDDSVEIQFEDSSPMVFKTAETTMSQLVEKATIGDGSIFTQQMLKLFNSPDSLQYGSCQDSFSSINTPFGNYWISGDQGNIFFGKQEISQGKMNSWFEKYLPFKLLEYFPEYKNVDNPISGIGRQTMYDSSNRIIYFTKIDYKPKEGVELELTRDKLKFVVSNSNENHDAEEIINIDDERFFESCSWTISYDIGEKKWISFHDWFPNLHIEEKNHLITIKGNGLWKHNYRRDKFCNYYGEDFPFEIEFKSTLPQTVTTIRNVEYYMEVFKYRDNFTDRYHILDENFDEAIIYNTEQVSGLLRLRIAEKNNPFGMLNFPKVYTDHIDILYSKEEQKYRFNQFWDITRDRGEFPISASYPTNNTIGNYVNQNIWVTEDNGFVRKLNVNNLNYNKPMNERKKFRHYSNNILLRKGKCNEKNFVFSLININSQYSPR